MPPTTTRASVKFGLQLGGTCVVEQDGRTAVLAPGDMVVYDTDRPYRLDFPQEARLLVLMLPGTGLELPPSAGGSRSVATLPESQNSRHRGYLAALALETACGLKALSM